MNVIVGLALGGSWLLCLWLGYRYGRMEAGS